MKDRRSVTRSECVQQMIAKYRDEFFKEENDRRKRLKRYNKVHNINII